MRRAPLAAAAAVAVAPAVPAVTVLGALSPLQPAALPLGWCRWRGPADRQAVAITFDDGPTPATERTLGLLEELGLRASFFLLGELAERRPGLCRQIAEAGHDVGCHGHRHRHHLLHGRRFVRDDLALAVRTLSAAVSAPPRWFRPPYGQLSAFSLVEARRAGMEVVLWSGWGREFADGDEARILARLERRLRPGAILLLHDSDFCAPEGTAARTHRVLPRLAEILSRRSLSAVTLGELVGR